MIFVTGPDTRTSLHVQHLTGARAGLTLLASLRDALTHADGLPVVVRPCCPRTTHRLLSANPDGLVSSGPTRKTSTSPLPESGKQRRQAFFAGSPNQRSYIEKNSVGCEQLTTSRTENSGLEINEPGRGSPMGKEMLMSNLGVIGPSMPPKMITNQPSHNHS